MPISGLVVTLAPPGPDAERALAWMREDEHFTLGEPEPATPRRLPVTLDTADRAEDKRFWDAMQDHPGIGFVDVACVFFEEDTPAHDPGSEAGRLRPADTSAYEATHARSRP